MTSQRMFFLALLVGFLGTASVQAAADEMRTSFRLAAETSLGEFGGIPFCLDLDGDEDVDVLWLQSPGLFHSDVFDSGPWKGRFSEAEKRHFCLTATSIDGTVLWQVGRPWAGSRPFVTHCAERALDWADLDGDGSLEIVCVRRSELLIIDGKSGAIEKSVKTEADNVQIVRLGRTGPKPTDWTILAKNSESAYPGHEYANPCWFYDPSLRLLKTADYWGAGHAPQAMDVDNDGLDEFVIGYNLVDHDLRTLWTFQPVSPEQWNAAEMHVDDLFVGEVAGKRCVVMAASDTAYLLDATNGHLIWKRKGSHPQHCQIGRFRSGSAGNQVFIHNKRADLELYNPSGKSLWRMTPPAHFPLGQAAACQRQKFHMFDPTTLLAGKGPGGTDLLIFTDRGWPYVIDGKGQWRSRFPYTKNARQDWGDVPGRPDDYGYGYYARVADFDGDGNVEVLINDRRFAWLYEIKETAGDPAPRSDAGVLHVDFENYVDGVVQALNAGVRWLGDPFSGREEGTSEVTSDFGFAGSRCGHVRSVEAAEIARIRLQRRYDVPTVTGDWVVEFVFRAGLSEPAELNDLTVWEAKSSAGKRVGVVILANDDDGQDTYRLDVLSGAKDGSDQRERSNGAVSGLQRSTWIRVIQHRRATGKAVDLWVGFPGEEVLIGTYRDLSTKGDLHSVELGDTSGTNCRGAGCWDDIRIGGVLTPDEQLAAPEPALRDVSREVAIQEIPIPVGRTKQLFVDDTVIESKKRLKRTLHPVRKHASNPLIIPEKPWEGKSVLLYGGVIRDPASQRFRMWYLAWGKQINQPSFVCYAESEDGLLWTKSNLGLVEYEGSKENNIVMPGWSQTTVLFDKEDPDPSRRYKAVLRLNGTRGFVSEDGVRWRDQGVILEQAYDGTSVHWDPVEKKWVAMVKIFRDGKRARGYAESRDFLNWTDTYYMATVDERDRAGDQMYALYMFHYETAYFGLLRMYHTDSDVVDIQLATSRNAKRWSREIREPFIPTSPTREAWDFANNSVPSTPPIRMGDELWFYYSGRNTLHNTIPNDGAIGLGTLRVDGFMSMDAGVDGGTMTTKPIRLLGDQLFVNGDAAGGEIRVELLRTDGKAVNGFSAEACMAVVGDRVRHKVRWKTQGGLAAVRGKDVRIRFLLRAAKLYSFWTESSDGD